MKLATNTSTTLIITFAENPKVTAAYPAKSPISGCLPTPKNAIAASGGNNIVPASDARLASIPSIITTKVTDFPDILLAHAFIAASISPTLSHIPAPIITTKTNPSGANPWKLDTTLAKSNCNCSLLSKFTTAIVSPVPG